MTETRISPHKRGLPRYPNDPERRMPGELRTYFLSTEELEELNKKYPPQPRKMSGSEKAARIANDMYKQRLKQVEKLKEGKSKMAANNREPKITKEQLLEECREHGTDWAAAKIIAKKYDLANTTIYNYMGKWGIKEELQEGEPVVSASIDVAMAERAAEEELNGGEFQLRRAGTMEKCAMVNLLRNMANMLTSEADGEYEINLLVTRGRGA